MKQHLIEHLQTPITERYDTIVVGGGTAGVVSAIAAARNGARTAIIESGNVLGGTLLSGGIIWMSFFNNYLAHDVEKKQVVGGIAAELVDRMVKTGNSPGHYEELACAGHESVGTHVDREALTCFLLSLMQEEGVVIYLRTIAVGAVMDGASVSGVVIENKSGRQVLACKTAIDASGDGDLAVKAGADWKDERDRHPIGYIFGMGNVDLNRAKAFGEAEGLIGHLAYGDKGSEKDRIIRLDIDIQRYDHPVVRPFMQEYGHWGPYIISTHENEATYINGMSTQKSYIDSVGGAPRFDPMDVESLSKAAVFLKKRTVEYARLLQQYVPGFENAYINWSADKLGVRSTRCIVCDYDITRSDVVHSVVPEDAVALFGSCDAFGFGCTIEDGKWFGIPYRAILPKGVENLFVIGRSITSDWVAHMSTRLVVSCMAQGEAAGTAAAICALEGCRSRALPVERLQERLAAQGVLLQL